MDPDQAKDHELSINLNKRDIRDIDSIMSRSEHAYNFAALESRWTAHMNAKGIIDKEERKQFLRQAWIDENELENHKEQARKTI